MRTAIIESILAFRTNSGPIYTDRTPFVLDPPIEIPPFS